ncbi:hypothetical protein [Fangia hongkongensis]|uniref:hypothetical protein n=3 Tax=Fangia hongkongensis TaxID=270495 RepID=UPI00035E203D|nr:hypothetical protein [Fangia hongkongensis]
MIEHKEKEKDKTMDTQFKKSALMLLCCSALFTSTGFADTRQDQALQYLHYKKEKKVTIINGTQDALTLTPGTSSNQNFYSYVGNVSFKEKGAKSSAKSFQILPSESKTFTMTVDLSYTSSEWTKRLGVWKYYSLKYQPPLLNLHFTTPKEYGYQKSCWVTTNTYLENAKGELKEDVPFYMETEHSWPDPFSWVPGPHEDPDKTKTDNYLYYKYSGKSLKEPQNQYIISTSDAQKRTPAVKNEDVTLTIVHCDDDARFRLNVTNSSFSDTMYKLSTPYDKGVLNSLFVNGLNFFDHTPNINPLTQYSLFLKKNGPSGIFFPQGALKDQSFGFSFNDKAGNEHQIQVGFPNESGKGIFNVANRDAPLYKNYRTIAFYSDGYILPHNGGIKSPVYYRWSDIGIPDKYAPQVVGITRLKAYPHKFFFFLRNGTYFRYDMTQHHIDAGFPKPTSKDWPLTETQAKMIAGVKLGLQEKDLDAPSFLLRDGNLLLVNSDATKVVGRNEIFNAYLLGPVLLNKLGWSKLDDIRGFVDYPTIKKGPLEVSIAMANGHEIIFWKPYCDLTKIGLGGYECLAKSYYNDRVWIFDQLQGRKNPSLACHDVAKNSTWYCEASIAKDKYGVETLNVNLSPTKQLYQMFLSEQAQNGARLTSIF